MLTALDAVVFAAAAIVLLRVEVAWRKTEDALRFISRQLAANEQRLATIEAQSKSRRET